MLSPNVRSGVMTPKGNDFLNDRLESAIWAVLVQYQGRYEESLSDWFFALRLFVPEMAHPWQLTNVFRRLSDAGVIELHKAGFGPYNGDDEVFFLGAPFTAVLTAQGMIARQSHEA